MVRVKNIISDDGVSEVMVVHRVDVIYSHLNMRSANGRSSNSFYQSPDVRVEIIGDMYSLKPSLLDGNQHALKDTSDLPKVMQGYTWFPLNPPSLQSHIDPVFVMGRLYEQDCYNVWYRRLQSSTRSQRQATSEWRAVNASVPQLADIRHKLSSKLEKHSKHLQQEVQMSSDHWRVYSHREEQLGIKLGLAIAKESEHNHSFGR